MKYPHFWTGKKGQGLAILLAPLGKLVCLVAQRRHRRAQAGRGVTRLPVPVVVVGNITVGGTGKTPLLISLIGHLRKAGWTPGVISRGYGGKPGADPLVLDARTGVDRVGDEPLMIWQRTGVPVSVHPDRVRAGQALLTTHPQCDVIISDDGLQHYQLGRDYEIAVIDRMRGIGNGRCLPAGPLREPVSRLNSVDAVVVNEPVGHTADQEGQLAPVPESSAPRYVMQLQARCLRRLSDQERIWLNRLPASKVHAVAGIGNPARFFSTLARLGLDVIPHAFPDHHVFSRRELDFARDPEAVVVMTEKDAVKWPSDDRDFNLSNHYVLEVDAHIPQALIDQLLARLDSL